MTSWTKEPNEILMITNVFKWNTCGRRESCSSSSSSSMQLGPQKHATEINELWQHVLQLLQLAFSKSSPVLQPILLKYSHVTSSWLSSRNLGSWKIWYWYIKWERVQDTGSINIDNHYTLYNSELLFNTSEIHWQITQNNDDNYSWPGKKKFLTISIVSHRLQCT